MIRILSIETSCDETSVAILDVVETENGPEFFPRAHVISSQSLIHKEYGGVFPAVAKREHSKNLGPVFVEAIEKSGLKNKEVVDFNSEKIKEILNREKELFEFMESNISLFQNPEVTHIAVTVGPGLEPALWVGVNFARALSHMWQVPIIQVNHMEGHLVSILLQESKQVRGERLKVKEIQMPAIALLVSGGHTELIYIKNWGQYEKIGQTVDDAAGEAFDKVARMLDLPYPGGPQISARAEICRLKVKGERVKFKFPRPMMYSKDFNFSFSGLKTAVLYHIRDFPIQNENDKAEIACEFENAVVEVLVSKTKQAIEKYGAPSTDSGPVKTLIVAGGVSANKHLQNVIQNSFQNIKIFFPNKELTGDNALMIAIAGYFNLDKKFTEIKADGNLSL